MGYSHYFRRSAELDRMGFSKAMDDVRLIIDTLRERGMSLAGPTGAGKAELSDFTIAFNGSRSCGHRYMDLGKPWPSKTAEGVEATTQPIVGPWFSGALLETRVCGGCCAGDPFVVDRKYRTRSWDTLEKGRYFSSCETGFKPYDLAVTAALIRLKEHLPEDVLISSDGLERGFEDAKMLCRDLFGWPSRFELEPTDSESI